jgi:hypothetical protein
MNSRITNATETIDRATSRSICEAIGERLRQNLKTDGLHASPRLQRLIDELRKQDQGNHARG